VFGWKTRVDLRRINQSRGRRGGLKESSSLHRKALEHPNIGLGKGPELRSLSHDVIQLVNQES